jgi:hypothetical protein
MKEDTGLPRTNRRPGRAPIRAQVAALLLLSPICAEYILGYDDSTGRPLELLNGLVVFVPIYGAAALFVREAVRRTGRGWPSMLLLATAFAVVQPGVIDQSLFSADYREIAGWSESLRRTYVDGLGLSASFAHAFVLGHVVNSFCAPIALVEAMRPGAARSPWLSRRGLAIVALLYLAGAAVVLNYHLTTESSHASAAQIAGTLAVAGAFVAGAFAIGPRARPAVRRPLTPRPSTVLGASFVAAELYHRAPETWAGVALAAVVVTIGGQLLLRASRRPEWGLAQIAAVAAGALLSVAVNAFTYHPVVGEVPAVAKYGHNVAMLLLLGAASWYALHRSQEQVRSS